MKIKTPKTDSVQVRALGRPWHEAHKQMMDHAREMEAENARLREAGQALRQIVWAKTLGCSEVAYWDSFQPNNRNQPTP